MALDMCPKLYFAQYLLNIDKKKKNISFSFNSQQLDSVLDNCLCIENNSWWGMIHVCSAFIVFVKDFIWKNSMVLVENADCNRSMQMTQHAYN